MSDKYDNHIARLTKYPRLIMDDWYAGRSLFQFATADGNCLGQQGAACLTMFRQHPEAFSILGRPDLAKEIVEDERLPNTPQNITVEHLPIFAEWQRRLDKEIRAKLTTQGTT